MTDIDSTTDQIIATIARSTSDIRQGFVGRRETAGNENPSGEIQAKADVYADELLAERLSAIDGVAQYASEERTAVGNHGDGALSVAIDPLDGTSNLRSNNPLGTVFGIYDEPLPARGTALVAAGYVIYGPITTMVCARDDTVTEYEIIGGERSVVTENSTLPETPRVYGFGGRVPNWTDVFREFASEIETELELHYSGAMINDVNQVLIHGGIFAYPALEDSPNGKLRLQFEANPIGYIVETAGGRSSDGTQSLLDVEPTDLHDRIPLHVGNTELIDRLESTLDAGE
ncbi:class 1 fructose-bisphosphatase [Halostagnicola sp. A-GB9-2]|uniref:class 1 fructose-bisphosphatase n=1 Tax=Halostagnicola sp. A-GB9-2 TaxID=3048066 RepID=UPI0024C014AF|nr:class 1 fructose-bisphosphatase [Halostagnicola sp. A-GB9-2]MDJ1434590.1 class 1 fructose-bisphosphatase [Halostagnicola sp. A-GB9-2]